MKEGYFHSLNEVATICTEISEVYMYDIMQERIFERIGRFQRGECLGGVFGEIIHLDININKYKPMSGSSYNELQKLVRL